MIVYDLSPTNPTCPDLDPIKHVFTLTWHDLGTTRLGKTKFWLDPA